MSVIGEKSYCVSFLGVVCAGFQNQLQLVKNKRVRTGTNFILMTVLAVTDFIKKKIKKKTLMKTNKNFFEVKTLLLELNMFFNMELESVMKVC